MTRLHRFGVLVLFAASAACRQAGGDAAAGEGGRLVMIDSVALQESDSVFLTTPLHMTAGRDGSLFVVDGAEGQVLRFSRTGALLRRFGRAGPGPGELGDPGATALVGDSLLAVAEWGNQRTSLFRVESGAFVRAVPHEGMPFSMQARGDTLWVSNVNIPRRTLLAAWRPGEDGMRYLGRVPRSYEESPALMEFHPYATLARSGDTLFVGLTGHHPLLLLRPDGAALGTVEVPAVRRRGVPADIARRFAQNGRGIGNEEVASMVSALVALHRLPSGEIAAVHMDVTLGERSMSAEGYLSVLSGDRRRACPDIPIPLQTDARPAFAFQGDTLVVVQQAVASGTRATAFARRYRVDTSGCGWVPAPSGG